MVKINENTSQPKATENKKCILSALIISCKGQVSEKPSGGLPIKRFRKSPTPFCIVSHNITHLKK